jgi:hypothetical protein
MNAMHNIPLPAITGGHVHKLRIPFGRMVGDMEI